MWNYPIRIVKDDHDSFLATSPDFPELTTFGDDRSDALSHAGDAIEEAIASRMARQEEIPRPSVKGRQRTSLSTQTVLKVLLYEALRTKKISKAGLANRLHLHRPQIDRLLNVRHSTKLETLDDAFKAVGLRVQVNVVRSPSDHD